VPLALPLDLGAQAGDVSEPEVERAEPQTRLKQEEAWTGPDTATGNGHPEVDPSQETGGDDVVTLLAAEVNLDDGGGNE
jgi:hypothetical protein